MSINSRQCRAARAMLNWSVRDLATRAGIAASTVTRFEKDHATPNAATLTVIRQAFERSGVEFTNGDAPGVRMRER